MSNKLLKFSGILATTLILTSIAKSESAQAAIVGTYEVEAPTIQYNQFGVGDGNGSITVYNQTFNTNSNTTVVGNQHYNSTTPLVGSVTSSYQWKDGSTLIGTYDKVYVRTADNFGGSIDPTSSGARSNYATVNPNVGGLTQSTLTLAADQRYFGLWWSAGDTNNIIKFYDKNNVLLSTFKSGDVSSTISKLPATRPTGVTGGKYQSDYKGNPTQSPRTNTGEYYAYLNFFDTSATASIRKIVFENITSTGFESDNHSVATDYVSIRGASIAVPEPLTMAGAAVAVGLGAFFKSKIRKNREIS